MRFLHPGSELIEAKDPDAKNASRLLALWRMAYCRFNLSEVIGVATENLSTTERSYDFAYMRNVEFENQEELKEAAKKVLGY